MALRLKKTTGFHCRLPQGRVSKRSRRSRSASTAPRQGAQAAANGEEHQASQVASHTFRAAVMMLGSRIGGKREDGMPESIYDVIQLIGTSSESWEKAAANAVEQASKTLRNLRIAEIVELDMQLDPKGKIEAYRAKVKLSFKVERS
jgi:flavin-binding protein dodecin